MFKKMTDKVSKILRISEDKKAGTYGMIIGFSLGFLIGAVIFH